MGRTLRVSQRPIVNVRWMIPCDYGAVLAIEELSFDDPMDEHLLLTTNAKIETINIVAEIGDTVVGHALYEVRTDHFLVLRLAVHPNFRRRGVGRALSDRILGKLVGGRTEASIHVREHNVVGQCFFRTVGWKVTTIVHDEFGLGDGSREDGYRFLVKAGAP